jgi:non-specific serine/threonine protein kinase
MSKAYSTKALPRGTVLREWSLEEVLGVGGFGIVYKGRGIYFNELVAIKEYFPSSISERNEDDTVVPVDSDSEEVHALGLKKFVEEAKLLWNLSTPTRHPNIVNVRSLFEVHGTAYMVMDFEDGVSLSKMLKKGHRFNEASLTNLVRPIAEGLDRAHRVGVLHRDIKPPNILINEDGKPVLIDFGSARFESADATSTKVTFHTPPYAAIEQYVKTYSQGPWTDIYALGVVLYECVTGQKPADVLERLHGGDETRLADGHWPGFSKSFLAAIDAAMTIKPADRPQSIAEWLRRFDGEEALTAGSPFEEDEATRMVAYSDGDEIRPVAPPPAGFAGGERPSTDVPDDPKQVRFKLAGQDTGVGKKRDKVSEHAASAPAPAEEPVAVALPPASDPPEALPAAAAGAAVGSKKRLNPFVLGGAGLALAAAAGGWVLFGGGRSTNIDEGLLEQESGVATVIASEPGPQGLAEGVAALLADARQFDAPARVVAQFAAATAEIAQGNPPGATSEAPAGEPLKAASTQFAGGLVRDAEAKARQLAASVPWASATNAGAARAEPANRQAIARNLRASLQSLRAASARASGAAAPEESLQAAREALVQWRRFSAGTLAAYRAQSLPTPSGVPEPLAVETAETTQAVATEVAAPATATAAATAGVSNAKRGQFNAVVSRANALARQVRALPAGDRPGSRASDEERQAYRALQADKDAARDYQRYLDRLESSMRGAKSDTEADQLIAQALQTEDYLRAMLSRSGSN